VEGCEGFHTAKIYTREHILVETICELATGSVERCCIQSSGRDLQPKFDDSSRQRHTNEHHLPWVGGVRRHESHGEGNEAENVSKHHPLHAVEGENLMAKNKHVILSSRIAF